MKRTRSKRNANSTSLQSRRGGEKVMRGILSPQDTAITAEKDIVEESPRSPDVEQSGRKSAAKEGSRTHVTKRKGIRNNPTPSAETLLNRQNFNAGLRRGLLQAATNNSPLPDWLLRRKQYDRAGEFFTRLRAELVTPQRRDQAKIKRMLAEFHSSQQLDAKQGVAGEKAFGQDSGDAEGPGTEDGDRMSVERPAEETLQQLSGVVGHMQNSMSVDPSAMKYQDGLRRALLYAAENRTLPNSYIRARSVASPFWDRMKTELLSSKRDEHKIKRMLDELKESERQGAQASGFEPFSAAKIGEEKIEGEKEADQNSGDTLTTGADVRLKDQRVMDDDDSNDDVFVRRPRRRKRLLARQQVEEEL